MLALFLASLAVALVAYWPIQAISPGDALRITVVATTVGWASATCGYLLIAAASRRSPQALLGAVAGSAMLRLAVVVMAICAVHFLPAVTGIHSLAVFAVALLAATFVLLGVEAFLLVRLQGQTGNRPRTSNPQKDHNPEPNQAS